MHRAFWMLGLLLCGAVVARAEAPERSIEASIDVWVRESAPELTYENDLISVWSTLSTDGGRRYGIVQFDLSSEDLRGIIGASLELWAGDFELSDGLSPIRQSAAVIDIADGTPAAAMTWNALIEEHAPFDTLEGLGRIDFAPLELSDLERYVGGPALELELDILRDASRADPPRLTLVLIADEDDAYAKSWGDGPDGFGGFPPVLKVMLDPVDVFADGFESGDLGEWSCVDPGEGAAALRRARGGSVCDR